MENRELIIFFGGLFIAIALIIALFIWFINTSNSKVARWSKYVFSDTWIKRFIIAWVAGVAISLIPCIGEVLGFLILIGAFAGFFIRVWQLRKQYNRFDLDNQLTLFDFFLDSEGACGGTCEPFSD